MSLRFYLYIIALSCLGSCASITVKKQYAITIHSARFEKITYNGHNYELPARISVTRSKHPLVFTGGQYGCYDTITVMPAVHPRFYLVTSYIPVLARLPMLQTLPIHGVLITAAVYSLKMPIQIKC